MVEQDYIISTHISREMIENGLISDANNSGVIGNAAALCGAAVELTEDNQILFLLLFVIITW